MDKLYIIVVIIAIAVILSKRLTIIKGIKNVNVDEAYQLIKNNKDVIIIDVRTSQEFKSGHISGAKSIPVNEINSRIGELEKYKENPILVHCATGGRSPRAVRVLQSYGFKEIYHMSRGLLQWKYGLK